MSKKPPKPPQTPEVPDKLLFDDDLDWNDMFDAWSKSNASVVEPPQKVEVEKQIELAPVISIFTRKRIR